MAKMQVSIVTKNTVGRTRVDEKVTPVYSPRHEINDQNKTQKSVSVQRGENESYKY